MTEKEKDSYFKSFLIILSLAAILDSYSTTTPNAIQTSIATAFLQVPPFNAFPSDAVLAFGGLFVSFGLYFVFLIQVLLDKFGRKRMLMVTTLGMGICAFLLMISQNFFMYITILFFNSFFYNADVFIAYASEEAESNKRMKYVNVILIGGLLGSLLMIAARSRLITETVDLWRGMFIIPIIIGILTTLLIQFKLEESSKYELVKGEREANPRVLREEIRALFKIKEAQSYKFLLIVALIFGMTHSLTLFLGQKYAVETLLISEEEFSLVALISIPGVLIVYVINGILADRIGRKPLLYLWSIVLPVAILLFAYATPIVGNRIVFLVYPLATLAYWGVYNSIRQLTLETIPTRIRCVRS